MLVPSIDRCFPLTAAGPSALTTIRFAGRGLERFIAARLSRAPVPCRPMHLELRDDRGLVDDPVALLREDRAALDLTTHGGTTILNAVRDLAEQEGFVWTVPPDRRPWEEESLVGIVDASSLREHEYLLALPHAQTDLALRTLLAQPHAWNRLTMTDLELDGLLALLADRSLEHLLTPPTVAIVGVPNAGKSTLANALFGQQRSIVSPVAGTTRDWVGEQADLNGLIVQLLDTPGLRQTPDEIERHAIEHSSTPIGAADLVVLLLDATRDDAEQQALVARYPDALRCVNKIDARLAAWSDDRVDAMYAAAISAAQGEGIDRLTARIHAAFGIGSRPIDAPRIWSRRQADMVETVGEAFFGPVGE